MNASTREPREPRKPLGMRPLRRAGAEVIPFPVRETRWRKAPPAGGAATILLFTGVRRAYDA
jgi:hypothetical protein